MENSQDENPGRRLRDVRQLLGFSQRDMAAELSVTSGAIAQWENGQRVIPGPVLKILEHYEEALSQGAGEKSRSQEGQRQLFHEIRETCRKMNLVLDAQSETQIFSGLETFFKDGKSQNSFSVRVKVAASRKLLRSLESSKGLSIKAAQLASYLEFGIPVEIRSALSRLQSSCKALPWTQIESILSEDYGIPISSLFRNFSTQPFAVTSLAQVHRATLTTGEEVAVKIQHPQIRGILHSQFKKVGLLAQLSSFLRTSDHDVLQDIEERLVEELDYHREARFQEIFRNIFEGAPGVYVPRVHRELIRNRVFVSEYVQGRGFYEFCAGASDQQKSRAGKLISYFHSRAIFAHGLLHGDAHPDNFLFRENDVVFLDFGRIIELEPETLRRDRQLYSAILRSEKKRGLHLIRESGMVKNPDAFDFDEFWDLLREQQHHHLVDGPFRFSREYVASLSRRGRRFAGRKYLKFDRHLFRAFLVNASLWALFADLEAEVDWRRQALEILSLKGPDSQALTI